MSGGLDSTSVAAIANKVQADRGIRDSLRAYTVDYTPLFEDEEGNFASRTAQHLGIPIEILSGASCLPFGGRDEPFLIRQSLVLSRFSHCTLSTTAK